MSGFNVPGTSVYLSLTSESRSLLADGALLIREGINAGLISGDSPKGIIDIDSSIIPTTASGYLQMVLSYGMYFEGLWMKRSEHITAIKQLSETSGIKDYSIDWE